MFLNSPKIMCYTTNDTEKIGGANWMAKIKFVVKELNKPSQFALSNLSQVVYNTITTKDTCNVEKDVTTKLNSATEVEKTA
jgi:hypothetical protein